MNEKTKYIEKLKKLYEEKNGITLSDEEAFECFEKLVLLVGTIYKPIPRNIYERKC